MTFEEMLLKRESCRGYNGQPVAREDLIKIAEAGRMSPSGCNAQPWKFIIVDDEEVKEKLRDALVVESGETGAPWRDKVPAFIVLVEQPAKVMEMVERYYNDTQRFAQGDIGIACINMCYQAMELGLSTCMIGMSDQEKYRKALGIPEGHEVRITLAIGYPAVEKEPRVKIRKAPEEIYSFNRW